MEVKISLKIKPLDVPHVLNEDLSKVAQPAPPPVPGPAGSSAPYIGPRMLNPSELDADDLGRLCSDYRAELFKRAGKKDPRLGVPMPAPTRHGAGQEELEKFFHNVADLMEASPENRKTKLVLKTLRDWATDQVELNSAIDTAARTLGVRVPYTRIGAMGKIIQYLSAPSVG